MLRLRCNSYLVNKFLDILIFHEKKISFISFSLVSNSSDVLKIKALCSLKTTSHKYDYFLFQHKLNVLWKLNQKLIFKYKRLLWRDSRCNHPDVPPTSCRVGGDVFFEGAFYSPLQYKFLWVFLALICRLLY